MIGIYELDELLSKYGIDASKILSKNDNVLTYGEYQEIKNVIEFLMHECGIDPRNIEKCPSILSYNTQNIRENYEFLKNSNIYLSNVETTLHVLSTNSSDLKETYKYVLENYGIKYINRTTSVLSVNVSRIKEIEKILHDKSLVISAAVSRLSIDEISKDLIICHKYNIPITGSVFNSTAEESEKIITVCKANNIPITGSVFLKTAEDLQDSIDYVKITYGEDFLVPLIINKNVKYLQEVLPYLNSLGCLKYVIKSASILLLTKTEIIERKEYIESQGDALVTKNGRFNSIFGLSRKNYKKLVGVTR